MNSYDILISPVFTEKSNAVNVDNCYVFKVNSLANKNLIRKAVEDIYSIKVNKIRLINYRTRYSKTFTGFKKQKKYKKAYISIKKGQVIDFEKIN